MLIKVISKIFGRSLGLLALMVISGGWIPEGTAAPSEIYQIDPAHSSITFRVKHMGITFVFGRFNQPEGAYALDDNTPENCFIDIRVKAENIDTGNETRDAHLRSPDFFDADKFPEILFQSVFISKVDESVYRVIGHLTLHGVTQFVTVEAMKTGVVSLPDGEIRTGFQSTFTVYRSHYGMETMLGGIADKVELTVSVEGIKSK